MKKKNKTECGSVSKHPQVEVEFDYGEVIRVDEGIIDLLSLFWKEKYDTILSCQDNNGKVWIEMTMLSFNDIVVKSHEYNFSRNPKKETLYDYLCSWSCDRRYTWDYDADKSKDIYFNISLRFPKKDKEKFIKLWKETFDKI